VTPVQPAQRVGIEPGPPSRRLRLRHAQVVRPCRFGVYNMQHKNVCSGRGGGPVPRLSPSSENYFAGLPDGFRRAVMEGFMAATVLLEAQYERAPVRSPGPARESRALPRRAAWERSMRAPRRHVGRPRRWCGGQRPLTRPRRVSRAAEEFAAAKRTATARGEDGRRGIYVRNDAFPTTSSPTLSSRGSGASPVQRVDEYSDYINFKNGDRTACRPHLSTSPAPSSSAVLLGDAPAAGLAAPHTVQLPLPPPTLRAREFQGESVLTGGARARVARGSHRRVRP
jgi:hypothetical protein